MKDSFYGDKRDLVKWGGLIHLCKDKDITNIMWVMFFRTTDWGKIYFGKESKPLQDTVVNHFKKIQNINKLGKRESIDIIPYDEIFSNNNRNQYINNVIQQYVSLEGTKVVFLDPDNGLAPSTAKDKHVASEDVRKIWSKLKPKDWLVMYQHFTRKSDWRETQRREFADACGCSIDDVNQWDAPEIANDVIFFYLEKK